MGKIEFLISSLTKGIFDLPLDVLILYIISLCLGGGVCGSRVNTQQQEREFQHGTCGV